MFAFSHATRERDGKLPPNNVPAQAEQGDVDSAMETAPVTIDVTYTTPSQNSAAMEPHASLATWDDDGALTLYGAYQMPTSDAQQLAKSLGVSEKKVRIIARFIGGGFGSKLGIAPESVAAAVAAKKLGRPVKAVMLRPQVFDATPRRSNTVAAAAPWRECRRQADRDRARDDRVQPADRGLFRAGGHLARTSSMPARTGRSRMTWSA